jgi:small subunit ribosomal protein S8
MSDPISNLLTSIRNAGGARLPHAIVPHSKMKESIARVLQREGYVADVVVEGKPFKTIKIKLKYTGRKSVIEGLRRVSSPGLRRYIGSQEIPRVLGGM